MRWFGVALLLLSLGKPARADDAIDDQVRELCAAQAMNIPFCVKDMLTKALAAVDLIRSGGAAAADMKACEAANYVSPRYGTNWRGAMECEMNRELQRKGD